jgi:hypothetical protein
MEALPHRRPLEADTLFRVDAASGFRVDLAANLVNAVRDAVDRYVRLFHAFYPASGRSPYGPAFLEIAPPDVDLPLLDLYHRLPEPARMGSPGSFPEPDRPAEAYRRVRDRVLALAAGSEAVFHPGELEALLAPVDPPRWMAGVLFQVAQGPEGPRIALNALFHGSGLALARFHELHGTWDGGGIVRTLRDGWESLVPEGAIPAEITYTHWGRTANASLRPRLFAHEIELPGDKATPNAHVIPLDDLTVRYDPGRERFRLRWASRNLEVVPFLSSGVRPEGFVAFLVHIGMQDLLPVAYFPGFDAPGVVHWPRVRVVPAVLFRERWVFGEAEGPPVGALRSGGAVWFEALHRWRREHRLPRRVFAATERQPKPFYVDLESPLFAELLRRFLAASEGTRFTLTEMFPGPDALWLRDGAGGYASEFLIQCAGPRSSGRRGEPHS